MFATVATQAALNSLSAVGRVGAGVGGGRVGVVDVGGSADGGDGWDVVVRVDAIAGVVGVDLDIVVGLDDVLLDGGWHGNVDVGLLGNLDVVDSWDDLLDELGVGVGVAEAKAVAVGATGSSGSGEEGSDGEFHCFFKIYCFSDTSAYKCLARIFKRPFG